MGVVNSFDAMRRTGRDFLGRKRGFDTGRGGIRKRAGDAPAFEYPKEGSRLEERCQRKKEGGADENAVF
jgi:hypothetical protein